jgi:hypothetical protein
MGRPRSAPEACSSRMVVQAAVRSIELWIGALVVGGDAGVGDQAAEQAAPAGFRQPHASGPSGRLIFTIRTGASETPFLQVATP